jgi:CubicO group peptidase (beta-lactamase class C family)/lysophospholipase L1-like esterase
MDSHKLTFADAVIQKAVNNGEIPGAVLGIVKDGKLAYLKAYGNKQIVPEKRPMDVNTVFDLASCSKSVSTAVSAMILVERGQLRLIDRVSLFIPEFKGWENGRRKEIRIIDLLTHTSGLPPYAPVKELEEKYGAPNPNGLIEYISTCKRDFEPQTRFQYSCLNYITLQRIIETISGVSLQEFAKQNIFNVLGMKHTDYNPKGETLKRCAPTELQPDGSVLTGIVHDPLARIMNGGVSGNAGLFSDANDLAILAETLLNGGEHEGKRILSPLGVKVMTTIPRDLTTFGRTPGWDIYSPYASNNGDIFGGNTFGHTGYTGTSLIIDPDNQTAVILLTNRAHPNDKGEVVRLRSLVANVVASSIYSTGRSRTTHYTERVKLFNKERPITAQETIFLGNSLTENGGDWGKRLKEKNVRNRGISGDEAQGIIERLHQILPGKPARIFLLTGVNDLSHDLSADSVANAIGQIIDRIQADSPDTKIYLQSLLPINESFERYKKLTGKTEIVPLINQKLQTIADNKKITYIDLFPHFTEEETLILRKELTGDGLHLNEKGYDIWVKQLKPYF